LVLNWYGPSQIKSHLPSGNSVSLQQETDYPRGNRVRLRLGLRKAESFVLTLRIPYWSQATSVRVNGKPVSGVRPARYLSLERKWKGGDTVDIVFDFSLHFWVGERECANKASVYRGPILLTYDRRFNDMDPDQIPVCSAPGVTDKLITPNTWLPPMVLVEFPTSGDRALRLCDFASAGVGGSLYRSWLPVTGVSSTEYSPENPLRSGRANG
jgi:hypothetical protein